MRRVVVPAIAIAAVLASALGVRADRPDASRLVAREIADRVASFPNFRAMVAFGEWRTVEPWSIRETEACHASLREGGVGFAPMRTRQTPIPAPVRLVGAIGGVRFRKAREAAPVIVACELAARLPAIAEALRAHGIVEVRVMSAWRRAPSTSFHTMGLALDLASFVREDGTVLDVERDYVARAGGPSCAEGEETGPALALRALACDLADRRLFNTVITPAYSPGHRSHLHVDIRPDDPRLFVR